MKFSELQFVHAGCCGTHNMHAMANHANGITTQVYDSDEDQETGPYEVTTWHMRTLRNGPDMLPDQKAVVARLKADAAIKL